MDTMKKTINNRWMLLAALPAALALAACDRHPTEGSGAHSLGKVEIIDRSQVDQPVVATWVAGEGWTGALPVISLGAAQPRVSLGARMYNALGAERTLAAGGEYSVRWRVPSGAPGGIVDATEGSGARFHGDHVHIYGLAAGTTQVQFLLWHFDHLDAATASIDITVAP
jgi:hypothetical protein